MRSLLCLFLLLGVSAGAGAQDTSANPKHLLYVAVPGIRDYPQYGGTGVLVFDIDRGHQFVRRIPVPALGNASHANAAKGICASAVSRRLYVSTPKDLTCLDLETDKVLWEKAYEAGCDRMSISPDGKTIYEPTLEGEFWHVIDGQTGAEVARINTGSGSHNTIFGLDGRHVYLAGLHAPLLTVADGKSREAQKTVGPFAAPIRPFTINGHCTLCYVNVNGLLGFEIGDLVTGKKLFRVEVQGFPMGPTKRHGCPSHGVGLTPDEKELWLTDAHNGRLQIFDNTVMPPKQMTSIALRDQPGWITFSVDGRYAYPSTGDVIETRSRKIVATLKDENGQDVQSEKLMEIDFAGGKPVRAGDQFGLGRVTISPQ